MNMALHSYDLFFYLNAATIEFIWEDYRSYLIGAVGSWQQLWLERRWPGASTGCGCRFVSGLALVVAVMAAAGSSPTHGPRRRVSHVRRRRLLCLRVLSLLERHVAHSGPWTIGRSRGENRATRLCGRSRLRAAVQAAAHRPDPSGVAGATKPVSAVAIRSRSGQVFPAPTTISCTGSAWRPRRRVLGHRVRAVDGHLDQGLRRHADVRAGSDERQAQGHAAAIAGELRLSNLDAVPDE